MFLAYLFWMSGFFLSTQEADTCIGCMQKESDIKLVKLCDSVEAGQCVQCYCRPMWCLECMGKWFASRQDQQRPEVWMSGSSPCPTCRAKFCVLDVCKLVKWHVYYSYLKLFFYKDLGYGYLFIFHDIKILLEYLIDFIMLHFIFKNRKKGLYYKDGIKRVLTLEPW